MIMIIMPIQPAPISSQGDLTLGIRPYAQCHGSTEGQGRAAPVRPHRVFLCFVTQLLCLGAGTVNGSDVHEQLPSSMLHGRL